MDECKSSDIRAAVDLTLSSKAQRLEKGLNSKYGSDCRRTARFGTLEEGKLETRDEEIFSSLEYITHSDAENMVLPTHMAPHYYYFQLLTIVPETLDLSGPV